MTSPASDEADTSQRSGPSGSNASNAPTKPSDGPSEADLLGRPETGWRRRLFSIVFESDTPAGRTFDLALIAVILASVVVVVFDSVESISRRWSRALDVLEWGFTVLFTLEYVARLVCVRHPWRYVRSFYGAIDLLAVLPTYLAVLLPSFAYLIDVRILRLLRVFRIFKLSHYAAEYRALGRALAASRRKITVFLGFVVMVVLVAGTLMYIVEGSENGYTSIPVSIYWAISTMTTVGFGDIAPKTGIGRLIASVMMLVGWGILAVPTGIVTAELSRQQVDEPGSIPDPAAALKEAIAPKAAEATTSMRCAECSATGHADDARYCRRCGAPLTSVDAGVPAQAGTR